MIDMRDAGATDNTAARAAGTPPPLAGPAANPTETEAPGIVVSMWQAFSEWQLEPDAARPPAVDEVEWELP